MGAVSLGKTSGMKKLSLVIPSLLAVWFSALFALEAPKKKEAGPKLQFINASQEEIAIFWINPNGERVSNGILPPSEETIIATTLGHEFEVIGKQSKTKRKVTCKVPVQGFRFDPASKTNVPTFYSQEVKAMGYPIVASAKVNPYALKEAAYLASKMLAKRPDVAKAMVESGARMCVMAYDEFTTDLPEFARLAEGKDDYYPGVSAKNFWDARARGLGGSLEDPFCSCGEENLLGYPGDPYAEENILIHEFAHNIHLRGMVNVDATFDDRLEKAYQKAMKAELWKDKYAATNRFEYFAEGVQSWFGNNRENDHDHNHVNTREELLAYDPVLAGFCREVFGDTELVYTKPATRLTGHMAGYDPSTAPTFEWPERLQKAKAEIKRKSLEADQK